MFNKSLLIKIGLVFLGLGAVTAMAYYPGWSDTDWNAYFPQSIYDYFWKKPKAPEITLVKNEGSCGARIFWYDNATDEDGVRLYRRVNGGNFDLIRVTLPHAGGSGSFDDGNLPIGTYEYKVSVFNENGESFSEISDPVVITEEVCGNEPLLPKPLNPLITGIELVKNADCTIRLYYQDNSNNEDGIRVYRWSWVDDTAIIAELPASNQPNGFYDDANLPDGHYTYQISVFNNNGESYSNVSDEVEIDESKCGQFDPFANPLPVSTLTSTPTPAANNPQPQACIWTSSLNVFVRKGPSSTLYSDITAVVAGTSLPVVGQSEDGEFWVVEVQPGLLGYIPKAEKFGRTTGDCNPPILQDPEPPVSAPTDEPSAEEPQTPACSDGVDNDGDNLVDMRDRECSSPDDTSEQ